MRAVNVLSCYHFHSSRGVVSFSRPQTHTPKDSHVDFRRLQEPAYLLMILVDERGVEPRPPRCERGKQIHKTPCCNHLRSMKRLSNGVLGERWRTWRTSAGGRDVTKISKATTSNWRRCRDRAPVSYLIEKRRTESL